MKDAIAGYDDVKEFEGRKYTGMRVGGKHSWYYGEGEWEETKVAPDKWQFAYAVKKRRKWDAPEGSGAPTGTEYHWYILAHQNVRKLNANEYATSMTGVKFKLAHRRAGNEEWSAGGRAQLRQLIAILEENIVQLKRELGGAGQESGAIGRIDFCAVATNQRWKHVMGRRRLLEKSLPPSAMTGQPSLETFMAP